MTSREKVRNVFAHKSGPAALWTGNPEEETVAVYAKAWGLPNQPEAIFSFLGDDCRWVRADKYYRDPDGRPLFDPFVGMEIRKELSAAGCFENAEDPRDLDNYPWPEVKYLDFEPIYREIDQFGDKMVFTGVWSGFFHKISAFLGMENYFIQMYENPKLIDALTERVVDFYVEANEKFFAGLGDRADVMFFGNDFGTQRDLLISPECFDRFILPSIKRLIAVGKKYNKKVMMHSCGAIGRIIPKLIDAGVDILHPIQAQAAGMSADDLRQYRDDISFVGGIDAQSFFVNATPQQIKDEVYRVYDTLGPSIVISPSHEAILPNVPPENVQAMAEAVGVIGI